MFGRELNTSLGREQPSQYNAVQSASSYDSRPREPLIPLIKEYGLNYIGLHIMI